MCVFFKKGCTLTRIFSIHVPIDFCQDRCGETPQAKLRMLKRLGVEFDADYDGSDLLEWVQKHGKRKADEQRKADQAKRQAEAEAERQRMLSEMPPWFKLPGELAIHLKDIYLHFKATKQIFTDKDERQQRLETCKACPSEKCHKGKHGKLRCKNCGCFIKEGLPILGGMIKYKAIKCKDDHWKQTP